MTSRENEQETNPLPENLYNFFCQICGQKISEITEFMQHTKAHSAINAELDDDYIKVDPNNSLNSSFGSSQINSTTTSPEITHKHNETVAEDKIKEPISMTSSPSKTPVNHEVIQDNTQVETQKDTHEDTQDEEECFQSPTPNSPSQEIQSSAPSSPIENSVEPEAVKNFDELDNFRFQLTTPITEVFMSPINFVSVTGVEVLLKPFSVEMNRVPETLLPVKISSSVFRDESPDPHGSPTIRDPHRIPKKKKRKSPKKNYFSLYDGTYHGSLGIFEEIQNSGKELYPLKSCTICNRPINGKMLPSHRRLYHPGVNPYICDECPYEAKSGVYLSRHRKAHRQQFSYICVLCSQSFETDVGLGIHMNAMHYVSQGLGSTSTPSGKITPEFQANIPEYIPKIEKAQNSQNLENSEFNCRFCPRVFFASSTLNHHEASHTKPYKCSVCSYRSGRRHDVQKHEINVHGISDAKLQATITPRGTFKGSNPSQSLSSSFSITPEKISSGFPQASSGGGGVTKFKCTKCDKAFVTSSVLRRHYTRQHSTRAKKQEFRGDPSGNTVESFPAFRHGPPKNPSSYASRHKNRYKCSECSYTTHAQRNFTNHRYVHLVKQQFQCPLCTASFGQIININNHLRRVHDVDAKITEMKIKNREASISGAASGSDSGFTSLGARQNTPAPGFLSPHPSHISKRAHLKKKCFDVNCPFSTADSGRFREHIVCHQVQNEFKCNICTASFSTTKARGGHMSYHKRVAYGLPTYKVQSGVKFHNFTARSPKPIKQNPMGSMVDPILQNVGVQCHFCEYKSAHRGNMRVHIRNIHMNNRAGSFKCPNCSVQFSSQWNMTNHMKFAHRNNSPSPQHRTSRSPSPSRRNKSSPLKIKLSFPRSLSIKQEYPSGNEAFMEEDWQSQNNFSSNMRQTMELDPTETEDLAPNESISTPSTLIMQKATDEDQKQSTITVTQKNSNGLKITAIRFN